MEGGWGTCFSRPAAFLRSAFAWRRSALRCAWSLSYWVACTAACARACAHTHVSAAAFDFVMAASRLLAVKDGHPAIDSIATRRVPAQRVVGGL